MKLQIVFLLIQLAVDNLKLPLEIDLEGIVQVVLLRLRNLDPHDPLLFPDGGGLGGEEVVEEPLEAALLL